MFGENFLIWGNFSNLDTHLLFRVFVNNVKISENF